MNDQAMAEHDKRLSTKVVSAYIRRQEFREAMCAWTLAAYTGRIASKGKRRPGKMEVACRPIVRLCHAGAHQHP